MGLPAALHDAAPGLSEATPGGKLKWGGGGGEVGRTVWPPPSPLPPLPPSPPPHRPRHCGEGISGWRHPRTPAAALSLRPPPCLKHPLPPRVLRFVRAARPPFLSFTRHPPPLLIIPLCRPHLHLPRLPRRVPAIMRAAPPSCITCAVCALPSPPFLWGWAASGNRCSSGGRGDAR
ncbi:hypothetical protein I4F81_007893 [Pyropia yezoensis]|uniref:Uncharacterized protein n=1 Tax=Pyropia yezoensis TaxID=2788 RepID=A0ACC3C5V2_PYRYE|nr:hypothetical protein I4F81_007893 [Neopyropia yezoensis]